MQTPTHDLQLVRLEPFEEIRGKLESIEEDEPYLYVELSSGVLRFDIGSTEAAICKRELPEDGEGYVGILRTPVGNSPIRIRLFDSPA